MFILGGCMLHLCVSGALYRPLHVHVIVTRNERRRKQKLEEQVQRLRHSNIFCHFCVWRHFRVTRNEIQKKKVHFCVNLVVTSILPHKKDRRNKRSNNRYILGIERQLYFAHFWRHLSVTREESQRKQKLE
jgi:hypothetical protein